MTGDGGRRRFEIKRRRAIYLWFGIAEVGVKGNRAPGKGLGREGVPKWEDVGVFGYFDHRLTNCISHPGGLMGIVMTVPCGLASNVSAYDAKWRSLRGGMRKSRTKPI